MKNATYLFIQPSRFLKNSESRWTAVAQMSLIYISSNHAGLCLPYYHSDHDGWLIKSGELNIKNFKFNNTVCEQGLIGEHFGVDSFDMKFHRIAPDITSIDHNSKLVTFIEVKTISESVIRNINLYKECEIYINSLGWRCSLFYLLSHGHEKHGDWPALSMSKSKILLWEDLFRFMATTPMSEIIGESLCEYCDPHAIPAQQGNASDALTCADDL